MAENKYGKITTEKGDIPEDEPVFLLRAQDVLAQEAIYYYYTLCVASGADPDHCEAVLAARSAFTSWEGTTKLPGKART